ncbi:MAG TPA: serine O-acetyltransferase [Clostridiales bacterium]|nr:serine O-acetyltransferase [Clostridiales bacterium]
MSLYADAKSIAMRDPAAKGVWQVVLLYPGFHVLISHRIAHCCYRHHLFFLARAISQIGRFFTLIEIHPGAKIGKGLFIDHGSGVVIGETAEIGDYCTIYHGVTLGGTGKEKGKRHPTVGNNVLIGTGAKILGPFKIGDNAMIGANAVVLNEVPAGATVVGVPGKVTRVLGEAVRHSFELDHGNAPDPIEQEICMLLHRVNALEKKFGLQTAEPGELKKICNEQPEAVINETQQANTTGGQGTNEDI